MKNAAQHLLLPVILLLVLQGCASPVPPGYDASMHEHRPDYIAVQSRVLTPGAAQDAPREIDTSTWTENQPRAARNQPNGREAVQVRATENGVQVGFDLLGIRHYRAGQWARDSWGPLKLITYPVDYVGYMATNHPWQTLGAGLLAWELADDGVSSLFDGGSGKSSGSATAPAVNNGNIIQVTGDNNTVTYAPSTSTTNTTAGP